MVMTRSQTKSNRHPTVSNTLPMDVISDILSRLPVKSILRLKSVSKTWYNMIKDPIFIKQHQNYVNLNPNPTFSAILSTFSVRETGKQIFRVNLINALDKPIDLVMPFVSYHTSFDILGICNGLVCIMMCEKLSCIIICNPLTGEFRRLPKVESDCTYFQVPYEDIGSIHFGFGLNGDNGYELFMMFYNSSPDGEIVIESEAYSLATNTWRKINVKRGDFVRNRYRLGPFKAYDTGPVFASGVFYWAVTDSNYGYILSFDVEEEVFNEFRAPDDCSDHEWILNDINEELAVVIYHDQQAFNIWVLNEKRKSWVLMFEIEEGYEITSFHHSSRVMVLGCARSGELVVVDHNDKTSKLYLYDMDTGDLDTLRYVNVDADYHVYLYTESLVSVNVGDEMVESDSD